MKCCAVIGGGLLLFVSQSLVAEETAIPAMEESTRTVAGPAPVQRKTSWEGEILVRFAAAKETLETNSFGTRLGESVALAIFSVPAGLGTALVNPLAVFAPVVGAATIPMGQSFRQQQEALLGAMSPKKFGTELADALLSRLEAERSNAKSKKVSFTVEYYGLVARNEKPDLFNTDKELCLVMRGVLKFELVKSGQRSISFDLNMANRSPPLPPPNCASFLSLSHEKANLMRQLMEELGQLIAAWAIHVMRKG